MKFEPESINNDVFEGHVELKIPHARDRALAFKKLGIKLDAQGQVVQNEDVSALMVAMIDMAEEHIVDAKIVRKEDGKEFGKEDIFYMPEFQQLISDVGNVCMGGFSPSKK
jgi:hypothetical protein